jgi:hypothetical protein
VHGGGEEAGTARVEEARGCGAAARIEEDARDTTRGGARWLRMELVSRRHEEEEAPPGRATAARSARDECREGGGRCGVEGWRGGAPPWRRAATEI